MESNIKMRPKEIGVNVRNLIGSAQDKIYWRNLMIGGLSLWVLCHVVSSCYLIGFTLTNKLNLWLSAPKGATPIN